MQLVTSILLCVLTLSVIQLVRLWRNLRLAKACDLPVLITPFIETESLAFLIAPILRRIYASNLALHHCWPRWCRFIIKDWTWEEKRLSHVEYGESFLVVSPGGIILYTADAIMADEVFTRRNDFIKPPDKIKLLEPFGPNVATTEGKTYQFHVRVTAAAFGDNNGVNDLVWNETTHQTRRLLNAYISDSDGEPSQTLPKDINNLTLSIICRAGFGQSVSVQFNQKSTDAEVPEKTTISTSLTFFQAMLQTTEYIFAILVLPKWFLKWTTLWPAYVAHRELESHMRRIIQSEKRHIDHDLNYHSAQAQGNLLTSLLRFSAIEQREKSRLSGLKRSFTQEEVMGNLFIYLLAGHETTANAMYYALVMLAIHPEIQAQACEEVDRLFAKMADGQVPTYEHDYCSLQYVHGFMYEIFRLFPGALVVTKMNPKATTVCTSSSTSHHIPAGTRVYLNAPAIHYASHYWPDPGKIDPSRWTQAWTEGAKRGIAAPDRTRQMQGRFITFSEGSRACLGRRFAQAEMAAFLVTVLRDVTVQLGEGAVREKVEADLFGTSAGRITLAPLRYPKIVLKKRVRL